MNKPFKRRFDGPRLTPEQIERQSRVSRLALTSLGSQDAIAFLNAHDDGLGGRPLDLALASPEGLAAVEDAIAARAA